MNPIDTMPTEGEFLARYAFSKEWTHVTAVSKYVVPGRTKEAYPTMERNLFDAWFPIPTANHRLVTVEDLAELYQAAYSLGDADAALSLQDKNSVRESLQAASAARAKVGLK